MKRAYTFHRLRASYGDELFEKIKSAGRVEQDSIEIDPLVLEEIVKGKGFGLGDLIHKIAAPIGKALNLDCMEKDKDGNATLELVKGTPCWKRQQALNKVKLPL